MWLASWHRYQHCQSHTLSKFSLEQLHWSHYYLLWLMCLDWSLLFLHFSSNCNFCLFWWTGSSPKLDWDVTDPLSSVQRSNLSTMTGCDVAESPGCRQSRQWGCSNDQWPTELIRIQNQCINGANGLFKSIYKMNIHTYDEDVLKLQKRSIFEYFQNFFQPNFV